MALNLLSFDIGASNGCAYLGEYTGDRLEMKEVHRFDNGPTRVADELYWDVLRLLKEIKTGIRKADCTSPSKLNSIGIDTWGVDYAYLDSKDRLITNPYCYRDERTEDLLPEIFAKISRGKIYELTGIQFMRLNTLVQLYADLKYRPWVFDVAENLLFTPDLFNYFLTGRKFNEETIASTSQFFNPRRRDWAADLFEKLDLPAGLLGKIIKPGNKIGRLKEYIKSDCNLGYDISVMAGGCHDTASAVAATPLNYNQESVFISSGTWSLLGKELEDPIINERSLQANFTNEMGLEDRVRFLKNISGLWLIQECRRNWAKEGKKYSYEEISRAAEKSEEFRFILDPNEDKFLSPQNMPETIKEYCQNTDQSQPRNYGEMARSIYESLALSYRYEINKLEDITGGKMETINIVGGGIKAEILSQFTADATGKKVLAGPVEATALGNILGQLMAQGEINNLKEGRELIKRSVSLKEYRPRQEKDWDKAFEKYKDLAEN